jgi:hypothetical protein
MQIKKLWLTVLLASVATYIPTSRSVPPSDKKASDRDIYQGLSKAWKAKNVNAFEEYLKHWWLKKRDPLGNNQVSYFSEPISHGQEQRVTICISTQCQITLGYAFHCQRNSQGTIAWAMDHTSPNQKQLSKDTLNDFFTFILNYEGKQRGLSGQALEKFKINAERGIWPWSATEKILAWGGIAVLAGLGTIVLTKGKILHTKLKSVFETKNAKNKKLNFRMKSRQIKLHQKQVV